MTRRPITITEDTSIDRALKLMKNQRVRRLPVLDKHRKLVGIVSEKDLLCVSPSPATLLSMWEIPHLLSKIKMQDIMTKDVITVTENVPLEEVAYIMADNKVGGLPVVRDGNLVGIITETDMFKVLVEMLGSRERAIRLTMLVPEEKGMLAKITGKITEMGGNILALSTMMGEYPTQCQVTIRVIGTSKEQLISAMEDLDLETLDARYSATPSCVD